MKITIISKEPYKFSFEYKNYKTTIEESDTKRAQYLFLENGFEFLKIMLDDLDKIVRSVKHHYFDNSQVPYLGNDTEWFIAYWKWMDFRDNCELKFIRDASTRLEKLEPHLWNLAPRIQQLKRVEIKEQITEIFKLKKSLIKALNKYQQIN